MEIHKGSFDNRLISFEHYNKKVIGLYMFEGTGDIWFFERFRQSHKQVRTILCCWQKPIKIVITTGMALQKSLNDNLKIPQ